MFEITVKIVSSINKISHAEIRIVDLNPKPGNDNTTYVVSFSGKYEEPITNKSSKIAQFEKYENVDHCCEPRAVKLYSNSSGSLEDFIRKITERFKKNDFDNCTYNCSDAANFTLKYFFPISNNKMIEAEWQTFKCCTFPCCCVTGGIFSFFGTPPLIYSPADILMKARLLSRYYGDQERLSLYSTSADQSPKQQLMR